MRKRKNLPREPAISTAAAHGGVHCSPLQNLLLQSLHKAKSGEARIPPKKPAKRKTAIHSATAAHGACTAPPLQNLLLQSLHKAKSGEARIPPKKPAKRKPSIPSATAAHGAQGACAGAPLYSAATSNPPQSKIRKIPSRGRPLSPQRLPRMERMARAPVPTPLQRRCFNPSTKQNQEKPAHRWKIPPRGKTAIIPTAAAHGACAGILPLQSCSCHSRQP